MKQSLTIELNEVELPPKTYAISAVALDSSIFEEAKDFFFKFTACVDCSREEESQLMRRYCDALLLKLGGVECVSISQSEAQEILSKMKEAVTGFEKSFWRGRL